jgi:Fe-S cluster assembly iron-binding protein IscA
VLNVTEKAVDILANSLEASEATEEQSLRLARTPQGEVGLAIDEEREGDQVVKQEERAILVLDEEIATVLDGATLDVSDSPEGQRLTLRMPEEG